MAEALNTRVTRLEKAMAQMASSQTKFQTQVGNALTHLVEVQVSEIQRMDAEFARLRKESAARERRLDERIEKLVSAIGEFIRRQSNGKH